MSGSGLALGLAVLLIVVALLFGSAFTSGSNPEPGAVGRPVLQEYNKDGSAGRTYVFYWPWENPKKDQPLPQ